MSRALDFMDRKNEPASSSLLCAATNLLSEELRLLRRRGRRRWRQRVWYDSQEDIYKVLRGKYSNHDINGGRWSLGKERGSSRSNLLFQAIRSNDHEIDGMINELNEIKPLGTRLSEIIESLENKKNSLP